MLLIKARVDVSSIHGYGVFATENIPRGTLVWKFVDGIDIKTPANESFGLWRECLEHYAWLEGEYFILCGDIAKYINHSSRANLVMCEDTGYMYAAREIESGEELTENYESVYGDMQLG